MTEEVTWYHYHPGTIRVAQRTTENDVMHAIIWAFNNRKENIDVAFFGNMAGYIAFVGCSLAAAIIEARWGKKVTWVLSQKGTYVVHQADGVYEYDYTEPRTVSLFSLTVSA